MGNNIKYTLSKSNLRIKDGSAGQLLFFIIWPFGALLYSLRDMKSRNFLIIYTLFCILMCWNLDIKGKTYDDLSGICYMFMNTDSSTEAFLYNLRAYVIQSPDAPREIFIYFMMWLTRLFSDNPHTFFALCSLPYLFFQIKCFKAILEDEKFVNGLTGVLIIFLFMWPRDIITVQNPRFTVGLWLCIYVFIKSFLPSTKGNKHLLWLLLAPTIHSGFWIIASILLVCILVGKVTKHYRYLIPLVYLSIPFSFLSIDLMSQFSISFFPQGSALDIWISNYMTLEVEQTSSGTGGFYWVPILFGFLKTIAYLLVPIFLIRRRKMNIKDANTNNLISAFLITFAIANFIQMIPVLGVRFYWFIHILSIYVVFKVYGTKSILYTIIFIACAWDIFSRYFWGGAVAHSVPLIVFYTPLPYILYEYWGATSMNIVYYEGMNNVL